MSERAKTRIDTQIPRRKKTRGPVELTSEWEARQGVRTAGLKMTSDAMGPKKPEAEEPPRSPSA
jgi:hypothetical protein